MSETNVRRSVLGARRIHVWGNSCSGKSTLGAQLAEYLAAPVVELDALNWLPDWVGLNETDPAELERRMRAATADDAWVAAGSYTAFSARAFWDNVELIIWLDLPRGLLLRRVVRRSWGRWRRKELLWGTNYEPFWPQFFIWRKSESLIWWIWTQHERKRRDMVQRMSDPRWAHIRFLRLTSEAEVDAFCAAVIPS